MDVLVIELILCIKNTLFYLQVLFMWNSFCTHFICFSLENDSCYCIVMPRLQFDCWFLFLQSSLIVLVKYLLQLIHKVTNRALDSESVLISCTAWMHRKIEKGECKIIIISVCVTDSQYLHTHTRARTCTHTHTCTHTPPPPTDTDRKRNLSRAFHWELIILNMYGMCVRTRAWICVVIKILTDDRAMIHMDIRL